MSEVQGFYSGSSVFLTGATGSLGKLLLEKLLRSCPGVKRIYVLIRVKKGREPQDRLKDVFDIPVFGPLREEQPDFIDRVTLVPGDCALPQLGLSPGDRATLVQSVDVILHCAATVRFDQSLKVAARINVAAVMDLVAMAREMTHLKAFVHVSTAYSHCYRKDVDEAFYEEPLTGRELLTLVHTLSDEELVQVTPGLLGDWPNTYSFTKAIAEDVIRRETGDLPVAIVRPSIVTATTQEPLPGWIDNIYGPTGLTIAMALGVIRVLYGDYEKVIDLVPADYVVNSIIVAGAKIKEANPEIAITKQNRIAIYNNTSCAESPLKWWYFKKYLEDSAFPIASVQVVYHYIVFVVKNWKLFLFLHFFLHMIPAYVVDGLSLCIGRKPQCVAGYKKFRNLQSQIGFFTNKQWRFYNRNTRELYKSMNDVDKKIFPFSMKIFNWEKFLATYCVGVRVYLMKDPIETVPQGLRKVRILAVLHYSLMTLLFYCLYCGLSTLYSVFAR